MTPEATKIVDCFNHARALMVAHPDQPAMVLDELMFMFNGRAWVAGGSGFFGIPRYCVQIAGVRSWADSCDNTGAGDCLRRWLAHAREALHRARQAQQ